MEVKGLGWRADHSSGARGPMFAPDLWSTAAQRDELVGTMSLPYSPSCATPQQIPQGRKGGVPDPHRWFLPWVVPRKRLRGPLYHAEIDVKLDATCIAIRFGAREYGSYAPDLHGTEWLGSRGKLCGRGGGGAIPMQV